MRWIFVACIILTAAANVLSRPRQKRDLTYIENLIASKLFGTDTIVIQQPEIPKNETYQIYKIKGYDNILLKVIRKKEAEKEEQPEEHKDDIYQDPVIVNPDIAIIGSYLGTSTEAETLLAIEIAKYLLNTGVLNGKRDKLIKEVVVPLKPKLPYNYYVSQEHGKLQNILTEERDPFYVHMPGNDQAEQIEVVNRNQFPVLSEYPPIVLASEMKYGPLQTKHPYEQKGASGDMSYNNQDLIVPRTSKVPSLPQFIKLRLADVASIGSNPYLIGPQRPHVTDVMPGSYGYINPLMSVKGYTPSAPILRYMMERLAVVPIPASIGAVEEPGYVLAKTINRPILVDRHPFIISEHYVPEFMKHSSLPFDIRNHIIEAEIDKINLYINGELSNNTANAPPLKTPSSDLKVSEDNITTTERDAKKLYTVVNGKRDRLTKEIVVPMTPKLSYNYYVSQEHAKQQNILTEKRDPFNVHMPGNDQAEQIQVVNRNYFLVLPEYLPIVLASEIKYGPVQTKYSYEQKGETGDMLFESYNNQDVIVTRTSKVPPLPQLIKLADVVLPQSSAKTNKSTDEVRKDSIYVPPENIDIPPPNMIPKTNQIQGENNGTKDSSEINFNNARDDKLNLENENAETLQGNENSLNSHPIVVLDD